MTQHHSGASLPRGRRPSMPILAALAAGVAMIAGAIAAAPHVFPQSRVATVADTQPVTRTVTGTVTGTVRSSSALAVRSAPHTNASTLSPDAVAPGYVYTVGCHSTGDQQTGWGGTNTTWDLLVDPDNPNRSVGYVPDVWLDTGGKISTQIVPCPGSTLTHSHDPHISGPVGSSTGPTLQAWKITSSEVFSTVDTDAGFSLCSVGTVVVSCLSFSGAQTQVQYTAQAVTAATAAGIDPRLLLAIMFNESGCHFTWVAHSWACDELRGWLAPGHSLGIVNMQQDAFDDVKKQHPALFGTNTWADLAGNPDLDIKAAAWHLHDLEAALPAQFTATTAGLTRDELLAVGYNTGQQNMSDAARGLNPTQHGYGPASKTYVTDLHGNWELADQLVCRSGTYLCSL